MRRPFALLLVFGIAVVAPATSAWAITPTNGVYQGIVDGSGYATGTCGLHHNEGEGFFRVRKTSTGKKIVPPGTFPYCGASGAINYIVAPEYSRGCDPYNANIDASRIAISQGAFDFKGYTVKLSASQPRYHIHFKGAWVSATKVRGFTQTSRGSCVGAKEHWTMKLL